MKTIVTTLVLFICLFALNASATIRTVSNYAPVPAQYTNINAAITAANPGDTIYVHGSPTTYPTTTVTKRIVLIGAGYNPKNDFPYVSQVFQQILIYLAANGSSFIGISSSDIIHAVGAATDTIRDLTFKNCRLYQGQFSIGGKNYMNILIENCIFSDNTLYFTSGSATVQLGLVIRNCIFSNTVVQVESNSIVDHCIFIGGNTTYRAFTNSASSTFSNNIFHSRTISAVDATNCIFNNNLTFNCSTNILPLAGNSGTGNITNLDPLFVSYPALPTNIAFTHNYRLQATSPGINAATDGTDLGVYGGNFLFSMTGEPPFMPVMRKLDIYNTTVPFNGTLDIRYKSSVPVRD